MTIDNKIRYNNLDYTKSLTITAPIEHITPSRFLSFPRIFPSVLSAEMCSCLITCDDEGKGEGGTERQTGIFHSDLIFRVKVALYVRIHLKS